MNTGDANALPSGKLGAILLPEPRSLLQRGTQEAGRWGENFGRETGSYVSCGTDGVLRGPSPERGPGPQNCQGSQWFPKAETHAPRELAGKVLLQQWHLALGQGKSLTPDS